MTKKEAQEARKHIAALSHRYKNRKELDPDDIAVLARIFRICLVTKSGKPRALSVQLKILKSFNQFPLGQVTLAAYTFFEKDILSRINHPYDRYFLGMVRNDAGNYQKFMEEKEIHNEQIQKEKRIAERKSLDPRRPNSPPYSGFHHVRENVLRTLPSLLRSRDNEKDPTTTP
jgi:translation elongation factor EF-Ts